jgi:hypothetical protein
MYGPPLPVKRIFEVLDVVCKNVYGLLVEQAPGHDEDARAPVLIKALAQRKTIFYIRLGAPLDCSAISLVPA